MMFLCTKCNTKSSLLTDGLCTPCYSHRTRYSFVLPNKKDKKDLNEAVDIIERMLRYINSKEVDAHDLLVVMNAENFLMRHQDA